MGEAGWYDVIHFGSSSNHPRNWPLTFGVKKKWFEMERAGSRRLEKIVFGAAMPAMSRMVPLFASR